MYGMYVHKAVIDAQESEIGVTIHRVTAEYDSGEIVTQMKVPIFIDDTPEILAARVLEREQAFLIETIAKIADGEIALNI